MREQGIAQQHQGAGHPAPMYAQKGGNQNYGQPGGGERAQPVLGNQPPLPGAAMVRYIQPEEINMETALVPLEHYGGETDEAYQGGTNSYEPVHKQSHVIPEGHY